MVPFMQEKLLASINYALAAVASDVRQELIETVGLESEWRTDDKDLASVVLHLPEKVDANYVARAINLENLEAWLDEEKRLHIAISPFYTTKDVDQTVLAFENSKDNGFAAYAAEIYKNEEFSEKIRQKNAKVKYWLEATLKTLGIKVYPSAANFLLLEL